MSKQPCSTNASDSFHSTNASDCVATLVWWRYELSCACRTQSCKKNASRFRTNLGEFLDDSNRRTTKKATPGACPKITGPICKSGKVSGRKRTEHVYGTVCRTNVTFWLWSKSWHLSFLPPVGQIRHVRTFLIWPSRPHSSHLNQAPFPGLWNHAEVKATSFKKLRWYAVENTWYVCARVSYCVNVI